MARLQRSVEQHTNDLVDTFTKVSFGIFDVTGRSHATFEQGFYGIAVAKPTNRIKSALAVDGEILIIASTFPDQQQRTIKFVEQRIEESEGRLDSTYAIILHCDPEGGSKLRNWGRDRGLSVLAIKEGEALSSGEALERALALELYAHDPFDVTGPVSDDANFFGRRDHAIELARKLSRGQIRSCLGIRKIGKTSVINRVINEINTGYDCTCLMVDCSLDEIWSLSPGQLLNSIAKSAFKCQNQNISYLPIEPDGEEIDLSDARRRLKEFLDGAKKPFILTFDEIDYITPGSPTNPKWKEYFNQFWRAMRAVYQESTRGSGVFSILVGGVSTHWFSVESLDGIENSALALIPEEYLSPMVERASMAMIRRLGKVAGLIFDDSSSEFIATNTGNMPYWTRKCCSYINRNISITDRPVELKVTRIRPLVDSFIRQEGASIAGVALRHLFRVHPFLGIACSRCHSGQGDLVDESQKRRLRQYGILSQRSDSLSGKMLLTAFAELSVEEVPKDFGLEAKFTEEAKNELADWAEELAALNKRRNITEKRMREICLNFIRFDSMMQNKLSEVRTRVLSVLPEKQRSGLNHLPAEDVMNKFLWTDLVKLVGKEWQLFERIFGNKDAFLGHCHIINDRFDAHAKPADIADFALYRRSLTYLEAALAKVQ